MGLTKDYLRFAPAGIFGVVAAKDCNAVYLQPNRFVAAGGTNIITIWDARLQRKVRVLKCDSPALILTPNQDATLLAVGHKNGGISVYDLKDKSEEASPDPNVTFEGHTSEILSLAWDDSGTILASGGKDTRVILWDCVSETGIQKLKGHRGPITRVRFWKSSKYLVTSSSDATLRIWDMVTHACVHTIPGNSQIWDFCLWDDTIFMAESHLRLFTTMEVSSAAAEFTIEELGTILRHANDRTKSVNIYQDKYLIAIGARSSEVEIFYLSSQEDAIKKMKKRVKKNPEESQQIILKDLVRRGDSVRASEGKLRSADVILEKNGSLKILCCLPSNQLEVLSIMPNTQLSKEIHREDKNKNLTLLGFDGHRKLVRGIAFSSDKTAILTGSGDSFKIWNRSALTCVLTIEHEYPVVCCRFCPGDRHFLAGTTCGNIILGDVSTGKLTQIESSGEESVWGIDVFDNYSGFAACNGNMIQFYDFSMLDGKLRFDLKRQLDVQESILCVKISPNMKFLAVGLLDSTIKIFYLDTLKFHLSMYGHKLPVVSIDISSDSNLLTSCASDKSVKVWGLDFGDCHCTMLHTDGLVGCSFIENTHHITSVAKDSLNFYDGDNHQRIQTVKAHIEGGATCMAVGGLYVVTAGRDQTMRLFHRTQELLVLDDEREREREEDLEKESVVEKPELPALQTAESEKAADKLIEALDVFQEKPESHPLLQAYGAKNYKEFMLKILTGIKASELEQSIMLLPVSYVHQMIPALSQVLENFPLATELAIRALHGLMKFHLPSLSLTNKNDMKKVADLAEQRLCELKDKIGFNIAGLRYLSDRKKEREDIEEFREMIGERKRRKRKKDKALKRAMLTLSI